MNGGREIIKNINRKLYANLTKIDDSDEFFEFLTKPLRISVRVNTLKSDVDYVVSRLGDLICGSVPWCEEGLFINTDEFSRIPEHQLGIIFSQEAASMIPVTLMELFPGQIVLDIAAAPGAKTTQIAQYLENEGCIVANDVKRYRLNILISNIQRCGVLIAKVTEKDGRFFGRFENKFDSVLVDVPCSNVGMIRRNYKYAKFWNPKMVYSLSNLQKSLLMAAYKAVKPGGVIVYSTCTLDPRENEGVVDYLIRNTDVEIERIKLPIKRRKSILKFDDWEYSEEVRGCLRIHPQDNDTEAFFVAKLRKK